MKQRIIGTTAAISFLGLIVLLVLNFPVLQRTIDLKPLFLNSLAFSLILGLTAGIWLSRVANNAFNKFRTITIATVIVGLILLALCLLSNSLLPIKKDTVTINFKIEHLIPMVSKAMGTMPTEKIEPTHQMVYLSLEGDVVRIRMTWAESAELKIGEIVPFSVQQGFWGHGIINKLNSNQGELSE